MESIFLRLLLLLVLAEAPASAQEQFYMRDTEKLKAACQGHYSLTGPEEGADGPLTLKDNAGRAARMDRPEPPVKVSLYACVDFDGDGKKEAVIEHFTSGAHCCFDYHFYRQEKGGLELFENLYLRNGCDPVFRDLDHDGKVEILTLDDSFAYFEGLCFACSPMLPLILCHRDGQFVDCTRRFSALLLPLIQENLKTTDQDPTFQRGLALEYLALHILQGREEEGWAGARRHYPGWFSWLKENAKRIHRHLDHRAQIRRFLAP